MDVNYINAYDLLGLSAYDLLGLSLSLCGSAPATATKEKFILPMTHLYAQWCQKVASTKAKGIGSFQGIARPPSVYQCTWLVHLTNDDPIEYFLGVSLSGYSTKNPKEIVNASVLRKAVGLQ